jgi:hypothetical protein
VARCCERGDEPSGSGARELVLLDSTPDISRHKQMSVFVRIVTIREEQVVIKEDFV